MIAKGRTTTTRRHQVTVTSDDIIVLVRRAGFSPHPESKVFVKVPGGGDWSNLDLNIGEDVDGIIVEWTETA